MPHSRSRLIDLLKELEFLFLLFLPVKVLDHANKLKAVRLGEHNAEGRVFKEPAEALFTPLDPSTICDVPSDHQESRLPVQGQAPEVHLDGKRGAVASPVAALYSLIAAGGESASNPCL